MTVTPFFAYVPDHFSDFHIDFDAIRACRSLLHVARAEIDTVLQTLTPALKPDRVSYMSYKHATGETFRNCSLFNNYDEPRYRALLTHHLLLTIHSLFSASTLSKILYANPAHIAKLDTFQGTGEILLSFNFGTFTGSTLNESFFQGDARVELSNGEICRPFGGLAEYATWKESIQNGQPDQPVVSRLSPSTPARSFSLGFGKEPNSRKVLVFFHSNKHQYL